MNTLTNREIKQLLDTDAISYEYIKPILEQRFKVFTRYQVGNGIYRIDLIQKQDAKDINLFRILNNVYEYKELHKASIYFKDKIRWFKKD